MRSVFYLAILMFAFSTESVFAADASDPLIANMSPNKKVEIDGIEFEVFRKAFKGVGTFSIDRYKVQVGTDGKLYTRASYDGKLRLLSSSALDHAAQFVVDTDGQMYVFHNSSDNSDYDKNFLSAIPDLIASGNIVVSEGRVLAMSSHDFSGVPTEESLIKFMNLLRKRGYEEFPLVLGESDSAFTMVLDYYKRNAIGRDFYKNFLNTFRKHLESVDFHLLPRQGDCRASLQKGYKSRILRI